MMQTTVYDPLERYKNEYCDLFLKNAQEAFDELFKQAKIDKEKNQSLCLEIFNQSNERDSLATSRSHWGILRIICGIFAVGSALIWPITEQTTPGIIGLVAAGALLFYILAFLNKTIHQLDGKIQSLEADIQKKKEEALQIMQPLNDLFGWDIPAKLIQKTVPNLEFDPFFTQTRLAELENEFGYDGSLNENSSILFAQSGEINGNPFVVADSKTFKMGCKTYTGRRTISWYASSIGPNGKRQMVRRSQVLTASITKPYPEYSNVGFVLYGNDAAPHLEFTRNRSQLTDDGFLQNFRRKKKLKELKKFSQNLKDESQYILMNNHEFETLFETKDRTDEVEYRLLFTALAQKQMLSLIKDKTLSYGDDFIFFKQKKINAIFPRHLTGSTLDTNPVQFADYDFNRCKKNFVRLNQEYFRSVYFAMAPLLAIPLYQQMRTRKNIYADSQKKSSSWEWESLANYLGEAQFQHAQCVTDNILKTTLKKEMPSGKSAIDVTAFGFRGEPRTERVQVFGGDGRYHSVPVQWIEYLPVSKTTTMIIEEKEEMNQGLVCKYLPESANTICRRGIFARI